MSQAHDRIPIVRDADLRDEITDPTGTAIIRRMRDHRRFRFESGDSILFDVAAYRLDRELGLSEYQAVENNLRMFRKWPDIIFDNIA